LYFTDQHYNVNSAAAHHIGESEIVFYFNSNYIFVGGRIPCNAFRHTRFFSRSAVGLRRVRGCIRSTRCFYSPWHYRKHCRSSRGSLSNPSLKSIHLVGTKWRLAIKKFKLLFIFAICMIAL